MAPDLLQQSHVVCVCHSTWHLKILRGFWLLSFSKSQYNYRFDGLYPVCGIKFTGKEVFFSIFYWHILGLRRAYVLILNIHIRYLMSNFVQIILGRHNVLFWLLLSCQILWWSTVGEVQIEDTNGDLDDLKQIKIPGPEVSSPFLIFILKSVSGVCPFFFT